LGLSTEEKSRSSLFRSAGVVSAGTAGSRVLGLIREQVMAYFFGASLATDAFVAAFRIPNLLRDMFAEGALSSAFVPVFKEKLVKEDEAEAFKLANAVLGGVLTVVGTIVLLGIVATPAIIYVSANGFVADAFKFDLTINLTRIMFVYLLLVSLSALAMGMLNSFGRFGIPAVSPAFFNLGIIVTVLVLHRFLELPVYALAIGVLVGGLGQVAVQLPALWRVGYRFRPRLTFLDEAVKKVVRLFLPMVVGLSAGRINILVNTLLASYLVEGAISYLNYSFRLMHLPLGMFAVALGTVALPKVSEMASRGDREGLARTYFEALNLNMLVILPSAVFMALWARPIVSLIYEWGEFTSLSSANTARALLHYSYGLVGLAAVRVTAPVYYALGDSRLPMKISVFSVLLNMLLYLPLIQVLDFAGLAAATSLAGLVNFALLLYFLPSRSIPVPYRSLILNMVRMLLAGFFAFYTCILIPVDFGAGLPSPIDRVADLLVPMAVGLILYVILCAVFGVREIGVVKKMIFGGRRDSDAA
jgi:putative peptidoglycan lipid II flippase